MNKIMVVNGGSKSIKLKTDLFGVNLEFNDENALMSTIMTNARLRREFQINNFVNNGTDNNLCNNFYYCRSLLRKREEKQLFGIKKS